MNKSNINKWEHFENNGNFLKSITVDGYQYGEKMLDGVEFIVSIDTDNSLSVVVGVQYEKYFKQLNTTFWYKQILDTIIRDMGAHDVFSEVDYKLVEFCDNSLIETVHETEDDDFDKDMAKSIARVMGYSYLDVRLSIADETDFGMPKLKVLEINGVKYSEQDSLDSILIEETVSDEAFNLNETLSVSPEAKNIVSNPDILESFGLKHNIEDKDDFDNEFNYFQNKLIIFEEDIKSNYQEKNESLQKLNPTLHRSKYWELYYQVEMYNNILNKFFDKSYMTHPRMRLDKIKNNLEETLHKFTPYLKSISYKIKNEEDIEAYEKEYLGKELLIFFDDLNYKGNVEELPTIKDEKSLTIEDKKDRLSNILDSIEKGEKIEEEILANEKTVLTQFEKSDLKGRIAIKWREVYENAIRLDGEEDGLIKTYVNHLYNPETTTLDDKNLLLNLLIISKMQDFSVMGWSFDEESVKVSNTEINLKNEWWQEILNQSGVSDDLKFAEIVEKDLNLSYYTSFFTSLVKKADKISFGQRDIKMKKLLLEDDTITREGLMLDTILEKTNEGSILFITPDMEKWIQPEKIINDNFNKSFVKHLGLWKKRHIFVIDADKLGKNFNGWKDEVIFVNKGNSYLLNPSKPIIYFNVIENPFLEKPILKWYAGAKFEISMDKATRMRVDENFLD
jgi:type II secretory pathway component PulC